MLIVPAEDAIMVAASSCEECFGQRSAGMKASRLLVALLMVVALAGCAGREMVVDLYGSIIYE